MYNNGNNPKNEIDNYIKKLIDSYEEIKVVKNNYDKIQKDIDNIVIRYLENNQQEEFIGNYYKVKQERNNSGLISMSSYRDMIKEYNMTELLEIRENKQLVQYITNNFEAYRKFKSYKINQNKSVKKTIIEDILNSRDKKNMDILRIDLNKVKNMHSMCDTEGEREFLEKIMTENKDKFLIKLKYERIK